MKNVTELSMEQMVEKAQDLFQQGYRFVTIDCIPMAEGQSQFLYHFDKDLELVHFRVNIEGNTPSSISGSYFCAMLIENEIQDMFGMKFAGLVVNYEGKLLLTENVGPAPQVISNMTVQIAGKEEGGATDGR